MWFWSVAGVYACDVAEAVSTSRRAVCVSIIKINDDLET